MRYYLACREELGVVEETEIDVGEQFLAFVGVIGESLGDGVDCDCGLCLRFDGERADGL